MERFLFWQRWLFFVGLAISIFGIMLALLSGTAFFDLFNHQINPVFWGVKTVAADVSAFQQWIYGVLGATVAGWGIFLTFIAHHPFRGRKRWARDCLVVGLVVWFCVDTFISVYSRVYFNVAFNTVLLILVLLPVAFTRDFFDSETEGMHSHGQSS